MYKSIVLLIITLCFIYSSASTQPFPKTEQEAIGILCKSRWVVIEVGRGDVFQKFDVAGGDTMVFKFLPSRRYVATLLGVDVTGTWKYEGQQISLTNDDPTGKKSYLRTVVPDKIILTIPAEEGFDANTVLILQPHK